MSDILDRLKSASAKSLQRTLGSTIFDDAIAEVEKLREALQFYADPGDYVAPLTGGMGKLWSDCGQTAKNALESSYARH